MQERNVGILIDSGTGHCHLDFPDFAGELDALIARARSLDVARMVTISTRVKRHAEVCLTRRIALGERPRRLAGEVRPRYGQIGEPPAEGAKPGAPRPIIQGVGRQV
jgi:hypothetical protein